MAAMMLYAVMQGMPMKQMVRYARVPATASAGVDMMAVMGPSSPASSPASAAESTRNSTAPLPMVLPARRFSPAPTAWPMPTVIPIASPTSMTVTMCMTWLPMDTAIVPATPSNWPMMSRSAMP